MENEAKILSMLEKQGAILDTLVAKVDKLEHGQAKLEQGQAKLKQEVADLASDVTAVRYDIFILRSDVKGIKTKQAEDSRLLNAIHDQVIELTHENYYQNKKFNGIQSALS